MAISLSGLVVGLPNVERETGRPWRPDGLACSVLSGGVSVNFPYAGSRQLAPCRMRRSLGAPRD